MAPKTSTEAGLAVHPAQDLHAPPVNYTDLVCSYVCPDALYFCDCIHEHQPLRLTSLTTGKYVIIDRPDMAQYINYPDLRLNMTLPAGTVRVRASKSTFRIITVDRDDFSKWLECNEMMGIVFSVDDDGTIGYYYRAIHSNALTLMRIHQEYSVKMRADLCESAPLWGWSFARQETQARRLRKEGLL